MENQVFLDYLAEKQDQIFFQKYQQFFVKKFGREIKYGTAGFRDKWDYLEHVSYRAGLFMGICAKLELVKVLGVVVTASHNPIQDNGLKLTDFDGTMIRQELELQVEVFVNEPNINKAIQDLDNLLKKYEGYNYKNKGMVFIGYDTRPSSTTLQYFVSQGVHAVGSSTKNFGAVSTPMIHFYVKHFNTDEHKFTRETPSEVIEPTFVQYFFGHYNSFMESLENYKKKEHETILLDCSNGVGGIRVQPFVQGCKKYINIETFNTNDLQKLNDECGAEYVHKEHRYPLGVVERMKSDYANLQNYRCLSFDGDADRIVYFLPDKELKNLRLLDGDKEICLFGTFFKTHLEALKQTVEEVNKTGVLIVNEKFNWEIGMVQTAYANGASTDYIKNHIKVVQKFAPNGVKNSHPIAHKFDIGIYCESNGHGTFIVNHEKLELLKKFENLS